MTMGKASLLTIVDGKKKLKLDLRILPSLIVNPILHRTLLIFLVAMLRVEHFGFIQEFMVKAQDFLVLAIH